MFIFFFCLYLWCHIQEIIAKSNVVKYLPYFFFFLNVFLSLKKPFFPLFSSESFVIDILIFKLLVHFESTFLYGGG